MDFVVIDKLLTANRIARFAKGLHMRYHFSLVHGHETYIGDEAAVVGRILGIPSVFTLAGVYWYHLQNFGKGVLHRAVANMNATDRLVALSHVSAESYKNQGVRQEFEMIPYGVNLPSSQQLEIPAQIRAFCREKIVLLSVGFFAAEKRIEQSIGVLARLHEEGFRNTVLILIGKGPLEPEYRKIIERRKLADSVKIIGEVHPEDMPRYYSIADLYLHPSIVESFSMACLEAMSLGKPVICTSTIGLVEYLHPGRDVVAVPPDDTEALYQAALAIIQDPARRRALGQEAQRTAAAMSWPEHVRKIERVYEEVLSR